MKMTKKTDLVVQDEMELEVRVGAPRGIEHIDLATITIPTAKILQPTSPEVSDEDYDFKAGQIIHSLFMERLPELFIPISIAETNTMFVPKNDSDKLVMKRKVLEKFGETLTDADMSGMFICRAQDNKNGDRYGKCADCKFNKFEGNDKPICTANINVLAMFEEQDSPVVIRFSNTSFKHGKKLKDLIFLSRADAFARKYKLTPTKITKDGNNWFEGFVKPAGKPTQEEYNLAEELFNSLQGMNIEYDESSVQDEAPKANIEY